MKLTTTEKIKVLLKRQGMKEPDLANKMGISLKTIYNKYDNEGSWTIDELNKMADIFSVQITELVD